MATVKEINHDSSTTLSDFYTTTIIDVDGRATVTPVAALNGTTNGVNLDFDVAGGSSAILVESFVALVGNDLRFRFRVDWSNVSNLAADVEFRIDLEDNAGADIFRVVFNVSGSTLRILAQYFSDSAGFTSVGTAQNVSDSTELCVELRAIKETADGNADGEVELFVNSTSIQSIANADNFNRFGNQVARTNVTFIPGSATGDLYYDEWILDDNNAISLCAITLSLAAMTKPVSIDAAGEFIYVALLGGGAPILTKISTALNADGTTVFNPGAGNNIGVECGRFSSDTIWVAGNFDGTNVIEKSEDGGTTFVVKDDATIGDIRTFVMGPDSDLKLLVFDETNGDILETKNNGESWTSINATVTPEINAIARLGRNTQETVFGNDGGANNSINYSINSGDDLEDFQTDVYPNANATRVIVN